MEICVIGGTGHIGKFLVPLLIKDGHKVTVITSGRSPFPKDRIWEKAIRIKGSYKRGDKQWADTLSSVKCETFIDILGVDLPLTYNSIKNSCKHIIVCGSVWMLGTPTVVPVPEIAQSSCEFKGYALRYKEILYIKEVAKKEGICFTAILPPNISGLGKIPLEIKGSRDILVHKAMGKGETFSFAKGALNTLIGPCDASDVAKGFWLAVNQPEKARNEIFNVGSEYSLTVKEFIATYEKIYKTTIPIKIVNWEEFFTKILPEPGANFHFRAHMCPDITKIRIKLGYHPAYTPEESLERAVSWMKEQKLL